MRHQSHKSFQQITAGAGPRCRLSNHRALIPVDRRKKMFSLEMKLTSGASISINHAMITFSRQFGRGGHLTGGATVCRRPLHSCNWLCPLHVCTVATDCVRCTFAQLQLTVSVARLHSCNCVKCWTVQRTQCPLGSTCCSCKFVRAQFELLGRQRTPRTRWLFSQYLSACCRKWGLNWNWFGRTAAASPASQLGDASGFKKSLFEESLARTLEQCPCLSPCTNIFPWRMEIGLKATMRPNPSSCQGLW